MYWRFRDLPDATRRELISLGRNSLPADAPVYLEHLHQFAPLALRTAVALPLAAGLVFVVPVVIFFQERQAPLNWAARLWAVVLGIWMLVACAWAVVAVREFVRAMFSKARPFLLVSPKVLIRGDYAHGMVEAFVLRNAQSFSAVRLFDDAKHQRAGTRYDFTFPEGQVSHTVKSPDGIRRMEVAIECARDRHFPDGVPMFEHLVPAAGGHPSESWRSVTRPGSSFWVAVFWISLLGPPIGATVVGQLLIALAK